MKTSILYRQLAIAWTCVLFTAKAALAWPLMTGDIQRSECREALAMASVLFKSDAFSMMAPLSAAADVASRLVLGLDQDKILGGDDVQNADSQVFEKIPYKGDPNTLRNLYWQVTPQNGKRLLVTEQQVGWRGDRYTYYLADGSLPADTFLVDPDDPEISAQHPIISGVWWPLQILQGPVSNRIWAIDQNDETGWDVYVLDEAGMSARCRIAFMANVSRAVLLLPKPVQRFATLLAEALGSGTNEGTLQPTARIAHLAEQAWTNAVMRPWALKREPYNSRAEVDDGLRKWAVRGPRYRSAYRALRGQYPRAVASLASYYRSTFHMSPRAARATAMHSIDYVYRSYFVFHHEP
ncbi:hypothetical protein [Mesorhizobium sp. GbtcB19]|uniref:hypothetical protein n=1 Tax=Mesorhizobium sp. GbtcB19 TaxID=2824764 RepID=UPI001C30C17B|nr:hypothetical protein [Mesorhizobium sp. GbtcB19]